MASVAPIFLLSLFAAELLVPEDHQQVLSLIAWLAAPVELALLGFVAFKTHRIVRQIGAARSETSAETGTDDDLLGVIQQVTLAATGNRTIAQLIASEIGAVYYAIASWGKVAPQASALFSYHRRTNYLIFLGGFLFLGTVEVLAVHLLVGRWGEMVAWILTAAGVYGMLWLIGDYRAAVLRPIRLTGNGLILRTGLRWELHVPFSAIANLQLLNPHALHQGDRETLDATLMGQPRYLLTLHRPLTAQGPYGIRKTVRHVRFAVDESERFEAAWRMFSLEPLG